MDLIYNQYRKRKGKISVENSVDNRFNGSDSIGEIVANYPGASKLFKEKRIDFCCGGDRPLSAVLLQQNIEAKSFIEKLNQMNAQANKGTNHDVNWLEVSNMDLIDHVVTTHHIYLKKELPLLSVFVYKILRIHGANHRELSKLHELFNLMKIEIDQHLIEEEENVFPIIREYELNSSPRIYNQISNSIFILEADHSGIGDFLNEMRVVTHDYALPPEACRTYTLTYQKLEELEADMFQHIHLENNILFPRFT
ncbi:iron-sulfur cluster repair di-iron protein [Paenisporosarcina antarctica]|uniref:Iron-sulfur cluster repair di-iron protein n=1 Tax=Paenisporosarcina antarctica TaxID=417367 RepID=A0A4P6ZZQ3_9BACL|nr:iron-sulfur cluster repair di-iron protein [Paenisporosarcina antarctica]QBP42071.1 iron-sulfur cluster repair di-iron protein [Paenisporosarcina antarctica]